jgi:hypothetical protein
MLGFNHFWPAGLCYIVSIPLFGRVDIKIKEYFLSVWPAASLVFSHFRRDIAGRRLVRGDVDIVKVFTVEVGGASVHVEG